MSTEIERPWAVTERTPDSKRKSLTDQIVIVFEMLWDDDTENARALAQSTDKEDSQEGSVLTDKTLLAAAVKKLAQTMHAAGDRRVEELAQTRVAEIRSKINAATRRVGVDRMAIAARKAEFLALQASEPAAEQSAEQPLDGQHDVVYGSTDDDESES
jgi:hypothetical protein